MSMQKWLNCKENVKIKFLRIYLERKDMLKKEGNCAKMEKNHSKLYKNIYLFCTINKINRKRPILARIVRQVIHEEAHNT